MVEGRDIGSVVWPEAPVKVYLTADAGRARRPPRRRGGRLRRRPRPRSRCWPATRSTPAATVSPLVMADGAVHIDTTAYTLDEVIDQVVGPRRQRVPA